MTRPIEELVLVDTCIWAAFFKRSGGLTKQALTHLLKRDRVAIVGPVVTEVLLGFRDTRHAEWVASLLDGVIHLTLDRSDWRNAATLGRTLASHGHRLPLTDLVIASVCRRLQCPVFTIDPDFDHIEGINRFTANGL
ncbi:MAG: PIN domain-containing protein [Planctomycetaceae bacterium]